MRSYRPFSFNAIWFLIAANVLIFVVTLVRPDAIYLLGLTPALFLHQPWTIITSMFVHHDLWHILFNMICLYSLGSFSIRLVGERNFLKVYFIGGLLGNIFYILLAYPLGYSHVPGIGASGAIFAVIGVLVIMAPRLPIIIFPIPLPISLWIAVIIIFLISFFLPGIAWQAHLGGFILGLIAGYFFKRRRRTYY